MQSRQSQFVVIKPVFIIPIIIVVLLIACLCHLCILFVVGIAFIVFIPIPIIRWFGARLPSVALWLSRGGFLLGEFMGEACNHRLDGHLVSAHSVFSNPRDALLQATF